MEITLENTQEIDVSLTPGSTGGVPRKLDGPVNWDVTGTSARITFTNIADPNRLSALVQTVDDAEGDTIIDLWADSKVGPEVVPLREQIIVHVTAPGAETFGIKPGDPRPKTVPVPPGEPPPPVEPPVEPVPTFRGKR